MKKCKKCGVEKPLDQFRVDRGYRRGECNGCVTERNRAYRNSHKAQARAASRKYYAENTEKAKATCREWTRNNPERVRAIQRRARYGITSEQYQILIESQHGKCAICTRAISPLCVDHDHKTGRVRGLLCKLCNLFLGIIGDSVAGAERVVSYLNR